MGTSRQPMMFMAVDLPEPEEPYDGHELPWSMERLTPSRAWTRRPPWGHLAFLLGLVAFLLHHKSGSFPAESCVFSSRSLPSALSLVSSVLLIIVCVSN